MKNEVDVIKKATKKIKGHNEELANYARAFYFLGWLAGCLSLWLLGFWGAVFCWWLGIVAIGWLE